ncbi:DUF445 domain-containing protein [Nocardia tengchongensis]|uniref:DUF445 domain-containing protein n=1 Tax=Nocardia tengchongensis TaxID=2055889 RepID=UPI00361CA15E
MGFLHEVLRDVTQHWTVYAAMPAIAALIGYGTKLVAVEMMFRPIEFIGIPPYLGWQGIIPRYAARMASMVVDLALARILDPKEILTGVDTRAVVHELREPVHEMVEEFAPDFVRILHPAVWDAMPRGMRDAVVRRIEDTLPEVLDKFLGELGDHIDLVLDLRALAIDALTRDKRMTVKLIRMIGRNEMRFIVRIGLPFGLALGMVQAVVWALTHSVLIMPLFGAFTGLFTDWLALQMIFRPVRPVRLLGLFTWQGLFHKRRSEVTRDYAALIGEEVLTPVTMFDAMLTGPRSDRFLYLVDKQIRDSVAEVARPVQPLLVLAVGGERYRRFQQDVAGVAVAGMRQRADRLGGYASQVLDLPELLCSKMDLMTDDEFEGLLRPAFKQDEWKLVTVGALLGFLVGELQVHLLLS